MAIRQTLATFDINVRAGIHAGEIEVRGDDVAGMAVHIGARISARAGAGEVLVSSTVKDLVVGSSLEFNGSAASASSKASPAPGASTQFTDNRRSPYS